jgi:hypothetical protein
VNIKVLLVGAFIAAATAVGVISLGGSTVPTVKFAEATKASGTVEISGKLDRASVKPIRGTNVVAFDLVEEGTNARIAVLYQNDVSGLPANFPAASHARAAGVFDPTQRRLVSTRVYTKCPSKYKEDGLQLDSETKEAVDKWQKATGVAGA